ncbi:hypothetical protein GALL_430280 [mine drainage metagenome]|uniref:Uncharacterized protein n=1 Tax=mine drainage metagenome TaxID=410659 RepID=A0A1J5QCU1_9ZZZZ
MHVALARLRGERVELLLHAEHVERRDTQDLGLTALEQRRPVHPGQHLDLGGQRADVPQPAPVDAEAIREDALTDQLLGHRADRGRQLLLAPLELRGQRSDDVGLDLVEAVLTVVLVRDRQRLAERTGRGGVDGVVGVGLVVREHRELGGRLRGTGGEIGLRLAQHPDERLGGLEALRDDLLGGCLSTLVLDEVPGTLGCLGLDHRDRDVVTDDPARDDHVEGGAGALGVARERDPLTVDQRDAHPADRAREREPGELRRDRCGVDRQHVVRVVRVDGQDCDDDLDLVAEALDEQRAQRAVDETAREDRFGGRATFAAEERAGDLAGRVAPLLDVDRQGEEVELLLRVLAGRGRGEQRGLAVKVRNGGAGGLARDPAGLEPDGAGAEAPVVDDGFGELDLGTLHGCPPLGDGAAHLDGLRSRCPERRSGHHYRGPDERDGAGDVTVVQPGPRRRRAQRGTSPDPSGSGLVSDSYRRRPSRSIRLR